MYIDHRAARVNHLPAANFGEVVRRQRAAFKLRWVTIARGGAITTRGRNLAILQFLNIWQGYRKDSNTRKLAVT